MVNHKQLQLQGFTSTEDPEQKPKKISFSSHCAASSQDSGHSEKNAQ